MSKYAGVMPEIMRREISKLLGRKVTQEEWASTIGITRFGYARWLEHPERIDRLNENAIRYARLLLLGRVASEKDKEMSYDIYLREPVGGAVIEFDAVHAIKGGTYALGGTPYAHLNVTYNYSPHYRRVIDEEKGVRALYGTTGADSIPVLEAAISKLGDDVDEEDYWNATEGNAKRALHGLLAFAKLRPDGVWAGD